MEAPAAIRVAQPRLPKSKALLPYLQRIDESRLYSNFGPLCLEFERRLAARFEEGARICTAANGTQAIALALKAMDLRPGSFVALPAWTFVATAHAVVLAGLRPWFLDVDLDTWMLDPRRTMQAVEARRSEISAVIPVSAFGQLPDLAAWRAVRDACGVGVLIDAAAAFDTITQASLPVVVSLHATKVLGVGEGAFLATDDADLATRFRRLTSFGFSGSREAQEPASNAKLSEYTAAVGLAALDAWPGDRLSFLRAAQMLRIALMDAPQVRFQEGWGASWITSVCNVALPDGAAQAVAAALAQDGVDTRCWWGAGCHRSPAFADCPREPLPVTDRLAASTLGLPFAVDLDRGDITRIAAALARALPHAPAERRAPRHPSVRRHGGVS